MVQIYRQEVLSIKTRTIHLLGRKSSARISNTLLGFEVKSSFKRIHCPDLVTARYLKLFTEIGCHSIKLPYDPTVTARLIPELESAVERLVSGTKALFPAKSTAAALRTPQIIPAHSQPASMKTLIEIYTRPGCHLCEDAKRVILAASSQVRFPALREKCRGQR